MGDNALSKAGDMNDNSLLSEESLIAAHPGIAIAFNFKGKVLFLSPKARDLRDELASGEAKDVQQLIKEVIKKKKTVTGTVSFVYTGKQAESTLEITLIPFPERETFLLFAHDLSLDRNLRNALVDSRQRYKDLVEISSDFAWEIDETGHFIFVSPRGALGFRAGDFINQKPADFYLNHIEPEEAEAFISPKSGQREVWVKSANRTPACIVVSNLPMITQEGTWIGARGVCRDVTEDRLRDSALERAYQREKLLNQIVTVIRDEVEPLNMLNVAASATAKGLEGVGCRIYRHFNYCGFDTAAEYGECDDPVILENTLTTFSADHESEEVELGSMRVLAAPTQYNGEINGAIALFRNVSDTLWTDDEKLLLIDIANQLGIANEQIANHEHILKLSRTDSLTGLLNRRAFFEEDVPRRIRRLEFSKEHAALIYIDLDNFKAVNDEFGHQRGDDVLIALRDLLLETTRPGDAIARLGGDEFAVWMDGMSEKNVKPRVDKILEAGRTLKKLSEHQKPGLGMSIGVAIYDANSGETLDQLIARADGAMYEVKKNEKGNFAIAQSPGTTLSEV
ncbi:MAG: diguanylate cyclase [Rhodospirillales bacterium]|nr:diguanylate cyclase [Rhodospirillales bacterium]